MTANTPTSRARSMQQLAAKLELTFARGEVAGAPFRPRSTDIIIAPFAKCGTTWLQQMFHTLRTRGDTDYDDISRVVPWIETSPLLGIDLDAEQRANPRGFKSHASWDEVPKGGRYIVALRDPRDALVSMFRFMEGWFLEPGTVSLDEFARERFLRDPGKGYWGHLRSWWQHRHDGNVLLLSYERMTADPEGTIRRIAAFSGIALDDRLLDITLGNSSLAFMLKHRHKFDDLLMRELSERVANLPPGSESAKVRDGKVGSHRAVLGQDIIDAMQQVWHEQIEATLGYPGYPDLAAAL